MSIRAAAGASARFNSTRFVLEKEKHRTLNRDLNDKTSSPHEYAPGWNETLASASEAAVKADRSDGGPQEMQSRTVEHLKARRRETDGESSTTAYYSRDTVTGPLSGATGKEEVIVHCGKVVLDKLGADVVSKGLKMHDFMTPSEEDVKADRGEV
ncbi:hypothetical protein JR316_0005893 [Psilocybe cubensis]|uniref:Uncharacterized protein n=1 Tax=Psilocybe cubensis TaxID=181762 RepID=A0ACB8H037_PSICU|nr:hypothetical protein JR316_0005893 [Psilocybe cubensis]KAH9481368.1 hypothetical protein JR316_0005893 [Psilocybe cubensis]